MSWVFFAALAAVITAGAAITSKKTLLREHAMEFSCVLAIFNAAITAPMLISVDYGAIALSSWFLMGAVSILGAVAFLFVAKAIRHTPISTSSPLLIFGPGITAIFAFIFLRESLSVLQIGGLMLLVPGSRNNAK